MRAAIQETVSRAKSLGEVKDQLLILFSNMRKEHSQLGYVAGMIYSEGEEHVKKNIALLNERTVQLRAEQTFPLFSAVDIFYSGLFEQLAESSLPYAQRRASFLNFWQDIVGSGFITDIFMTPRWELSEGARDEEETAKKHGVAIHYL